MARFQNFDLSYDPVALTDEIEKTIIAPARPAVALFDGARYLTRLHTRLSPADMNSDPVFSFNPDLPDVSNVHKAVWDADCSSGYLRYAMSHTEQGFDVGVPNATLPGALRIEILGEAGPPTVLTDNTNVIRAALGQGPPDLGMGGNGDGGAGGGGVAGGGTCSVGGSPRTYWIGGLLTLAALALVRRRRTTA